MKVLRMLGPNIVLQPVTIQTRSGILLVEDPQVDRDMRRLMVFRVLESPPRSPLLRDNEDSLWFDQGGNAFVIPRVGDHVLCYSTMTTPWLGGTNGGDSRPCMTQIQSLIAIVDNADIEGFTEAASLDEFEGQHNPTMIVTPN